MREQGKEQMWELEIDEEAYRLAQMEMSNSLLKVKMDMQTDLSEKQHQSNSLDFLMQQPVF